MALGVPKIMTDSIFLTYGGTTGTSTAAQRTAAYCMGERAAEDEIGTFLEPTAYTGTFMWPPQGQFYKLPHDRVTSISALYSIHEAGCECADTVVELEGCAWIDDSDNGIIDVREVGNTAKAACSACCSCSGSPWGYGVPYQFRVVYVAGLPSGYADDPTLLMALTTFADLALEQMIDPSGAEGGPGDPGVQSFTAQGYGETRTKLKDTALGSSARANYAAKLLRSFSSHGALKLGW